MHPLIEIYKNEEELYSGWLKNILGLSIAALTILVSMMPEQSPSPPDSYYLAATWLLLALCIPCSLAASFRPIVHSRLKAASFLTVQNIQPGTKEFPASNQEIKLRRYLNVLMVAQAISIISFCFSFVALAVYACLRIL